MLNSITLINDITRSSYKPATVAEIAAETVIAQPSQFIVLGGVYSINLDKFHSIRLYTKKEQDNADAIYLIVKLWGSSGWFKYLKANPYYVIRYPTINSAYKDLTYVVGRANKRKAWLTSLKK